MIDILMKPLLAAKHGSATYANYAALIFGVSSTAADKV